MIVKGTAGLSGLSGLSGLLVIAAGAACVLPSPNYDPPTEGGPTLTEGSTSSGSTGPFSSTGGPGSMSGTGSETTSSTSDFTGASSDPTTSTATESATDSTSMTTESATDSTSGSSSTSGDAWACDLSPGAWAVGEPSPVTAVNSPHRETDPFITSDGLTLYLSSDRPNGKGGNDTYYAQRPSVDDAFGAPVIIPFPDWNESSNENKAELRSDGLEVALASDYGLSNSTIYFGRRSDADDPITKWVYYPALGTVHDPHFSTDARTLYFTQRFNDQLRLATLSRSKIHKDFSEFEPIAELNGGGASSPALSDDQRLILFTKRSNSQLDLHFAHRDDPQGTFNAPAPLAWLNTEFDDTDPFLVELDDSCALYFASNRGGDWDIYRAPLVEN